ncbi:MAG: DJ-1/PfpI family protein, partial [Pseudoclavibacter sp.]
MTEHDLHGRTALVIVTNSGVEQDELLRPVRFLQEHGAEVTIAAPEKGEVKTLVGDAQPGRSAQAEATLDEVDPAGYDVVVVPGGGGAPPPPRGPGPRPGPRQPGAPNPHPHTAPHHPP